MCVVLINDYNRVTYVPEHLLPLTPVYTKGGEGGFSLILPYNKDLKGVARSLRKNMTDAERTLWSMIRRKQAKGRLFSRQKTIDNYIVDFYCASAALVVELDGGQHYTPEGREQDRRRDADLAARGLTVLRFSDRDVLTNLESVQEEIWKNL
jgi:very-short-patch-repair endonuclease